MRRLSPDLLVLLLMAAAGFLGFLGQPPLFDWDEINFAEAAREMLATGNYLQVQINYQPFWEKPPLFFWLQALSMSWFGVGEYAARFPNAVIGIFTILALYRSGTRWRNELFGRLIALFYLATLLPSIYFKSGIIDPTFNFFIFLGLMDMLNYDQRWREGQPLRWQDAAPWRAGMWIGLATLTKGPVALLVTVLIYGLYNVIWQRFRLPWRALPGFVLACLLVVAAWYGLETLIHGPWFVEQFVAYQLDLFGKDVAGHGQPFYYHPMVFALGCFPMAAFAFRAMLRKSDPAAEPLRRFMIIWFWVIMVLFSIVKTKIIHYSSLLYFPGAFLAAETVYQWLKYGERPRWDSYTLLGLGLLVWGLVPSLLNVVVSQLPILADQVRDPIAQAAMRTPVAWGGWEWLIGAGFLSLSLGFIWLLARKRYLPALWLQAANTLLFINLLYLFVAPKVGEHMQGAPQAFFSELQGKSVYVMSAGYKSYLPYFYSRFQPPLHPEQFSQAWLINGEIDRDVYLSIRAHREDAAFRQQFHNFERLREAGGFVFYRRRYQP